jgi:peptidoglycan/LPS O-acetylase OafA/YrhL
MDLQTIAFTTFSVLFIAIAAAGAFKQQRKLFLTGIFLWSLIPVIGEGAKYSQDLDLSHLLVMALFFTLAVLTAPSKLTYNSENLAATHLAKKIGAAVIFVNLFQAFNILANDVGVPDLFGYFHIVAAIVVIYPVYMSLTNSNSAWKS